MRVGHHIGHEAQVRLEFPTQVFLQQENFGQDDFQVVAGPIGSVVSAARRRRPGAVAASVVPHNPARIVHHGGHQHVDGRRVQFHIVVHVQDPLVRPHQSGAIVKANGQAQTVVENGGLGNVVDFLGIHVQMTQFRRTKGGGRIGMQYENFRHGGMMDQDGEEVGMLQQIGAGVIHDNDRNLNVGWGKWLVGRQNRRRRGFGTEAPPQPETQQGPADPNEA